MEQVEIGLGEQKELKMSPVNSMTGDICDISGIAN
jgi:hypothetical protein